MSENGTWGAAPATALWHGEIVYRFAIIEGDGRAVFPATKYTHGYSNDPFPDPRGMCPAEGEVLAETLTRQWGRGTIEPQPEDGPQAREFRVWCETSDLLGAPGTYREAADVLRAAVRTDIRRHGQEAVNGVLSTFGYSIQVVKDGADITQSFMDNHPDCPLDDGVIAGEGAC
ncbi:hypothetical protein [Streptomyces sp. SBT349]|uniref:hypothetical protein n=1 Tax=Streptomyces sp. SBT349 TaxID=1580539 RepID=UPI000A685FED|nr:hypothetical protein [Streptomyces sp. SBT349]